MIDLPKAAKVIYLYGLTGTGKNYVGDVIGKLTNRYVYHADVDLTAEMKQAIAAKRNFTMEMRDRYFSIISDRILALLDQHHKLVVTQATYCRKHREFLASKINDIDFFCVTAPMNLIIKRLKLRGNEISPEYAEAISKNFEPPLDSSKIIVNDGGETRIVEQFSSLY